MLNLSIHNIAGRFKHAHYEVSRPIRTTIIGLHTTMPKESNLLSISKCCYKKPKDIRTYSLTSTISTSSPNVIKI
jgi:hypothetical protein